MSNKQCVLRFNDKVYYVNESTIINIPYFKSMYSGRFNHKIEDVDYKTMREFKLDFPIFCDNFISDFLYLLNQGANRGHYIPYHFDIVIQILRIFDFLNIEYKIDFDRMRCTINLHKNIKPHMEFGISDQNMFSYDIDLTLQEKLLFLRRINRKLRSNSTYNSADDFTMIFPGYKERLQEVKDKISEYYKHNNVEFYEETALYIMMGGDYNFNTIYCNFSFVTSLDYVDYIKIGHKSYVVTHCNDITITITNINNSLIFLENSIEYIEDVESVLKGDYVLPDYSEYIFFI